MLNSMTCRAALFLGPGQPIELRELPIPDLQDAEVLVQVDCCTICGSDLHTLTGARHEAVPSILGHEILGRVIKLGPSPPRDLDGELLALGDRVTWSTVVACGTCDRCRGGLPQKCRHLAKYGHEQAEGRQALSGGLAEAVLLRPGSSIIKVPETIPEAVICPANCATATVAAAFRAAGEVADRRVLLFGAGMLGLTAAAVAQSRRAGQVVVCDINPDRLNQAKRFGADHAVRWQTERQDLRASLVESTGDDAFDVVIEMSGAADAVEAACELGGIGSQVVLVGTVMKSRPVQVDPEAVVRKCQAIHGVHNYGPDDLRTAVAFLHCFYSQYPFAELVEHSFSLQEVNRAMATAIDRRPVRVAVRPFVAQAATGETFP